MSRHTIALIHEGEDTSITLGWDRPLQGYFMTIEKGSDEEDGIYWSNLDLVEPHPKELTFFLSELKRLQISLPQQMIDAVLLDGKNNIGNKNVYHRIENNE